LIPRGLAATCWEGNGTQDITPGIPLPNRHLTRACRIDGLPKGFAVPLPRGMEGGQKHVATDEEATLDQRADTLHNHPELIDIRWGKCMFHGGSVPQGSQDLKRLPPKSNALLFE